MMLSLRRRPRGFFGGGGAFWEVTKFSVAKG